MRLIGRNDKSEWLDDEDFVELREITKESTTRVQSGTKRMRRIRMIVNDEHVGLLRSMELVNVSKKHEVLKIRQIQVERCNRLLTKESKTTYDWDRCHRWRGAEKLIKETAQRVVQTGSTFTKLGNKKQPVKTKTFNLSAILDVGDADDAIYFHEEQEMIIKFAPAMAIKYPFKANFYGKDDNEKTIMEEVKFTREELLVGLRNDYFNAPFRSSIVNAEHIELQFDCIEKDDHDYLNVIEHIYHTTIFNARGTLFNIEKHDPSYDPIKGKKKKASPESTRNTSILTRNPSKKSTVDTRVLNYPIASNQIEKHNSSTRIIEFHEGVIYTLKIKARGVASGGIKAQIFGFHPIKDINIESKEIIINQKQADKVYFYTRIQY